MRKFIPKNNQEALRGILPLIDLNEDILIEAPRECLLRAWNSIFFLFGGLHPDEAFSRGNIICIAEDTNAKNSSIEAQLINRYYEESGWPLNLVPIAEEVSRRYEIGDLSDEEFYPSEAQIAGIVYREKYDY